MATCAFEKYSEENDVVQQLNELFGQVLNLDVIKGVAVSCHYDVVESSNKLLEITSPVEKNVIKLKEERESTVMSYPKTKIVNYRDTPLGTSLRATYVPPKISKKAQDIERAIKYIQKGYKVLVIMRGVPGCGKSYLAKNLLESTIGFDINHKLHILSTDDFFCQNGPYQYDPTKISDAHGWNHNRAFQAVSRGFSPIIIDNTNTQMWEMKPYVMMATDYGYIIEILEPDTNWCFNEKELAKRNSHGVSKPKIKEMIERYEKNVTPQKLLSAYNLTYKLQKPPQWRLYPPLNINNSVSTTSLSINSCQEALENYNISDRNNIMKSKSVSVLNLQSLKSRNGSAEVINLMDFNDDEGNQMRSQSVVKGNENEMSKTSYDQNLVDDILMCTNSENENSSVLLPSPQNVTDVILVDSSDDENETSHADKKLFLDLETTWGVKEGALRSWDIVTPVKDERNYTKLPQQFATEIKIVTTNSSCNTEEEYFQFLRNNTINTNNGFVKVINTFNRDINRTTPKKDPVVLKKPMLDKSCLTEDIFEDYDNHMSRLISLFPNVPKGHLKYWYSKHKGDLEWTIEFLLDTKEKEINTLIEDSDVDADDDVIAIETDSDNSTGNQTELVNSNERKSRRSRNSSDEHKDLKKLIESRVDINDEHYSKHLLKVKKLKFGNSQADHSKPGTSANDANLNRNIDISQPSTSKSSSYEKGKGMLRVGDIVTVDSDSDSDDFDGELNDKPEQTPEETIELNLGNNFVTQLEEKFGDADMVYPKGFQPVVQVPITLARQLYTFYIESVFQQMETQNQVMKALTKEDEELARKLQAKEDEETSLPPQVQPPPNLREIMDEQVSQGIHQREVDKWKDLNPDTLAAKLTRQKLFTIFPTIDKNILIEILHAHDNKYEDTVETLLASTRPEDVKGNHDTIKEPPLKEEVIQEMKEAHRNSRIKEYEDQREPTFYREEANRYLRLRGELHQKAQQYHQRGMNEVAQFYHGLASEQTQYYDRANSIAATKFLEEHSRRLQDLNTLDLHYLFVKEAIPTLDVFIDRNINLLRDGIHRNVQYLEVITGRGKRSENGISKIKPAVIRRLIMRNIKFVQLNPGLLKIKVARNSMLTCEFE